MATSTMSHVTIEFLAHRQRITADHAQVPTHHAAQNAHAE